MSNYKYPTPQLLLKAICNAIREKTGSTDKIPHQNIPDSIDNILTEEEYEVESQKLLDIIYGKDMKILDNKYISNIPHYRFYYNSKITTVNLPKCTSIENYAFNNCTSLTTVNLPECTSIGNYAFDSCTSLTTIILSNNQVVTSEFRTFYHSSIFNGTGYIYVPDNLVDSYKTDTNWSNYANQIKPLSELPSNLKEEYGYV